jgi:hypothetical protein
MQKKNMINLAILIVVAGGMFYGGMIYGKNAAIKAASQSEQGFGRGMGNRSGGANGGVVGGQRGQRGPAGSGFSAGQIISKDDTSITIKTREGGSKIVYYSGSTTIGKTTSGLTSDLNIGADVIVNGSSSADGSIAAENIQIRPAQPNLPD